MSAEILIERLKYGRLARAIEGKWPVSVDQSLGITSRSRGLKKEEAHSLLPAPVLKIDQLSPDMIDPAADIRRRGFLVVRRLKDVNFVALIRSRFRPDDGEGGVGRLYQQTTVWRIRWDDWKNYPRSILLKAAQTLDANPDTLPKSASEDKRFDIDPETCPVERRDSRDAEQIGAINSPLVRLMLDFLLPDPRTRSVSSEMCLTISDVCNGQGLDEATFLEAAGATLEILSDFHYSDNVSVVSGLRPDLEGHKTLRFLPSEPEFNRLPPSRESIEGRLINIGHTLGRARKPVSRSIAERIGYGAPQRKQSPADASPARSPSGARAFEADPETRAASRSAQIGSAAIPRPEFGHAVAANSDLQAALETYRSLRNSEIRERRSAARQVIRAHALHKAAAVDSPSGLQGVLWCLSLLSSPQLERAPLGMLYDLTRFYACFADSVAREDTEHMRNFETVSYAFGKALGRARVLFPSEFVALESDVNRALRRALPSSDEIVATMIASKRFYELAQPYLKGEPSSSSSTAFALTPIIGRLAPRVRHFLATYMRPGAQDRGLDDFEGTGCYVRLDVFSPIASLPLDMSLLSVITMAEYGTAKTNLL